MKKVKNLFLMLVLGLGTLLFNVVFLKFLAKIGFSTGISLTVDESFLVSLKDNPMLYGGIYIFCTFIINSLEELIFRFIPYQKVKNKQGSLYWIVGIISSASFALGHNIFGLSGIPIPQFILGLVLWMVIKKGYLAVLIVHISYNLPVFISLLLQSRL